MVYCADVIVDLQAGDTGKGKVAHALAKKPNRYTHIIRYNGGGNAGHTVYHNQKKFVTHFIPIGVFYGIKSIIGPGCVVNFDKLVKEINELESNSVKVYGNLFIDKRVHIITDKHIEEDSKDIKIGTTKTGNGPCYRDKYGRNGIRAEDVNFIKPMVIDIYDELYNNDEVKNAKILFEGAQGFELDIDWGDYPYVTSSHCTVGSAIMNGVPPQKIRSVYGIAKAYRTYVGAKNFEGDNPLFERIREIGQEFGATTGRKRQVDWLNVNDIIKACNINGVSDLIFNKLDVLETAGCLCYYYNGELLEVKDVKQFKLDIEDKIFQSCPTVTNITFSQSPFDI
jgi:adenylosuccinate synthase